MINDNCPSCGSDNYQLLYNLSRPNAHAGIGLPGIIKQCKHCDLIFKSFQEKAEKLYNENYADAFLETGAYFSHAASSFFKKILEDSNGQVNGSISKPRLLDIGSGVGTMLQTATELGYKPIGVELSPKLVEVSSKKGHTVINKNISDISLDEKFDAITMMDIIEHLENPKEVLKELSLLLKPDGEIIIYTPNHNSLIVKIASLMYFLGIKSPVENIFACTHTIFFTTKTLKKSLLELGYEVLKVNHFNYDISRPGQKVSLVARIGVSLIEKVGNLIGFNGFRVVVYAKPLATK
jgi:2-polyprenyl-3-methyl-5-hydroxy-6-metoxy-1,4-benzoquinol methylase